MVNYIFIGIVKPYRCDDAWWRNYEDKYNREFDHYTRLDSSLFPDLKWEDEPIEVDIVPKSNIDLNNLSNKLDNTIKNASKEVYEKLVENLANKSQEELNKEYEELKSYNEFDLPVNETVDELLNEYPKSNYPWIFVNDKLPEPEDDIFVSLKAGDVKRYYACWPGYLLIDGINRKDNSVDYWMYVLKIN